METTQSPVSCPRLSSLLGSPQRRAPRHPPHLPLLLACGLRWAGPEGAASQVLGDDGPGPGGGVRKRETGWALGGRRVVCGAATLRGTRGNSLHPTLLLGLQRDTAATPRPARDATRLSQWRAPGPRVTTRPANGRGPGCSFLRPLAWSLREGRSAVPASEELSARLCPPGARPGECSGGGGSDSTPAPPDRSWRQRVAAPPPPTAAVVLTLAGRQGGAALVLFPASRTRLRLCPSERSGQGTPPPQRMHWSDVGRGLLGVRRVQGIALWGDRLFLRWAVVGANLLVVGLVWADGQGRALPLCLWWPGRGPTCRPSARNRNGTRLTRPRRWGRGSSAEQLAQGPCCPRSGQTLLLEGLYHACPVVFSCLSDPDVAFQQPLQLAGSKRPQWPGLCLHRGWE